jgi:hypothetical protein
MAFALTIGAVAAQQENGAGQQITSPETDAQNGISNFAQSALDPVSTGELVAQWQSSLNAISNAFDTIDKTLPAPQQQEVQKVANQLRKLSLEQLYLLKISDVCKVGIVQCGDLEPDRVKSFVDVELDCRKAVAGVAERTATAMDRRRTFVISVIGLIVSILAFVFSVYATLRRTKKVVELEA